MSPLYAESAQPHTDGLDGPRQGFDHVRVRAAILMPDRAPEALVGVGQPAEFAAEDTKPLL